MAMRQPVVTIAHALVLCTIILVAHPVEPSAAMSIGCAISRRAVWPEITRKVTVDPAG